MAPTREADQFTSLRNLAAVCGALAGLGGITHGVGEVLQGNRATRGIVFNSWEEGRIANNLGGEPAISLAPNVLIAGSLTIVASLAVLVWAVAFVDRRHGGGTLVLLSLVMLLAGGGFGPPMLGVLAGLAAAGAHTSAKRWTSPLAGRLGRLLASMWPGLFWLCALNAAFLVVGSPVIAGAFDLSVPDLFVYSLFLVVVSMPLATLAGIARDVRDARDAAGLPQPTRPGRRRLRGAVR